MTRRPIDLTAEARRLRSIADDAKERLQHLEQRQLDALDLCAPGPGPRELDHARKILEAAEAQADAAQRMAQKAVEV